MQNNPHSPPRTASHDASSKPSILLTLVCLAVVHRRRPEWISITLDTAARGEDVSPQRLSRLCSRAVTPFQVALDALTRIGRPTRNMRDNCAMEENALLRSLLGVATSILAHVSLRRPAIRALVVGAFLRLKQEHPELTKKRFCETFTVSSRTFRHWMAHRGKTNSGSPIAPPPEKTRPPKRPPRRPRFGFQVILPDTQVAADTTDLRACQIPLKLVAAQDIGGRDQDLFDSIIVDDHESADLVVEAITEAVGDKQGQQVLTDQGTPYMAKITRDALEGLEAEHAPQKEGHPQGKATVERAFATVKQIAGPLLGLTDRIAQAVPSLRKPDLAKAVATLVLTALLKAYQAGARAAVRADKERAGVSADEIEDLAEQSREKARAETRSARLLLTGIHRDFCIDRPLAEFIRSMRRFPLPVLREAAQAFSRQAHRDDIHNRAAYFAAIVRSYNDSYQQRLAAQRKQKGEDDRHDRNTQKVQSMYSAWHADPAAWLADALDALAKQLIPDTGRLLFGGVGLGRRWLIDSIDLLIQMNGHIAASDIANGVFAKFAATDSIAIDKQGLNSVRVLFENVLNDKMKTQTDCAETLASAILRNNGP